MPFFDSPTWSPDRNCDNHCYYTSPPPLPECWSIPSSYRAWVLPRRPNETGDYRKFPYKIDFDWLLQTIQMAGSKAPRISFSESIIWNDSLRNSTGSPIFSDFKIGTLQGHSFSFQWSRVTKTPGTNVNSSKTVPPPPPPRQKIPLKKWSNNEKRTTETKQGEYQSFISLKRWAIWVFIWIIEFSNLSYLSLYLVFVFYVSSLSTRKKYPRFFNQKASQSCYKFNFDTQLFCSVTTFNGITWSKLTNHIPERKQ